MKIEDASQNLLANKNITNKTPVPAPLRIAAKDSRIITRRSGLCRFHNETKTDILLFRRIWSNSTSLKILFPKDKGPNIAAYQ